jgi:hypothetical protein
MAKLPLDSRPLASITKNMTTLALAQPLDCARARVSRFIVRVCREIVEIQNRFEGSLIYSLYSFPRDLAAYPSIASFSHPNK